MSARPGSGKQSARAGSMGPGGPRAPGCPQRGARTQPYPANLPALGCGLGRGRGDGGAERRMAQEPGATPHAGTQVSAVRSQTSEEGGEGCFRGSSRGARTPCRGASCGERRVPGSECGPAALFKAHRPLGFLGPPCQPADAPPRSDAFSFGGRRLVAFGTPGTSMRGAGGLGGVACSGGARSRETRKPASLRYAFARLSRPRLRTQAGVGRQGKGECGM